MIWRRPSRKKFATWPRSGSSGQSARTFSLPPISASRATNELNNHHTHDYTFPRRKAGSTLKTSKVASIQEHHHDVSRASRSATDVVRHHLEDYRLRST